MSTFRLIILLCVVASATSRVLNEENDARDRIHADPGEKDGMKARYGQRPFQVHVSDNDFNYNCGGVLIERNYVLTAAHCISEGTWLPSGGITVRAGLLNIKNDKHEQKQDITMDTEHVIINKGWRNVLGRDGSADIALLKLNKPFESDPTRYGRKKRVEPVKMYNEPIDTIVNAPITISGWGLTYEYKDRYGKKIGTYTDDLLVSTVKHARTSANNEFLVLTDTDGNVSCGGDSGGPATYYDKLVGITHAGSKMCGNNNKLSYYTSVYKYKDWICKNVDRKVNIAGFCGGSGGGTSGGGCRDEASSSDCRRYKRWNWCSKSYYKNKCKNTCGAC